MSEKAYTRKLGHLSVEEGKEEPVSRRIPSRQAGRQRDQLRSVACTARSDVTDADAAFQVAVLFLSVADISEADRSAGGEPIKIGLQRETAYRTAIRYGVGVVKEFVEIGAPATSLRRRPVLRRLLSYLKSHPDIRYVVFPGENRFARTVAHAELLRRHFCQLGVCVVHANWFGSVTPLLGKEKL
ncbi:recombinase family protein [Nocardia aurea]|uniref:Recombinase family protein n=1 Tax=Nocardia aurea TaxID=2144174 RepID=A0ABV3FPN9_9NOCA